MESTLSKVRCRLDSTIAYLTPLLPLTNCHMVEFFTQCHWEKLVPSALRELLEGWTLDYAVEKFWEAASDFRTYDDNKLINWISEARSHCVAVNEEYCLSVKKLQQHINSIGGEIKPEIKIKEFMNGKKSYEIQKMSNLVASLHGACATTCCVEAGGGRGHLPLALALGYGIPSLTVDCNKCMLDAASKRTDIMQKQWHSIAKKLDDGNQEEMSKSLNSNLHRFATAYVTKDTRLRDIVRKEFPEFRDKDVKLLLTGLHTCGNLGPDSLRIFVNQTSISALFNVPCCYHLLTENVDVELFDVFQKNYAENNPSEQGFPMSEHLRGYNLGRNARMLAAQSIDRVVSERQLPSESLLYRALLQLIVKKHKPDFALKEGKLKRVAAKCQDFKQYFKTADAILNLGLYDSLSDSYLTDICKDIDSQWKKIVLFYLLRLCLAQVIESVILLDRLLFLMENGFKNVYVVKLFDPIVSPRCHSIVAIR